MAETPHLLDALLRAAGPSGYEAPASAVWREAASFADDLRTDGLGSSMAITGSGDGPLLAIVGHVDEIGLVVTHIDDKGFLWFAPIGGWDPQILVGQRVEVHTKDGPVIGVAGRKPVHLLEDEQKSKAVKLDQLHIDVGAADGDAARELGRIGDPVVINAEPVLLPGGRLISRALDNRLGAYVGLEVARRCAERGKLKGRVAAVGSAQEEIGLYGARTSAFALEPDLAIAVDVTHATDAPGIEENPHGSHHLGSGPVIGRGSTLSPKVFEIVYEVAESIEMEVTVEASGRFTGTDADAIQISKAGVPAGLVSIPLRYMHSPVEMVDLDDVEKAVELLVAVAESLEPGVDLSR